MYLDILYSFSVLYVLRRTLRPILY